MPVGEKIVRAVVERHSILEAAYARLEGQSLRPPEHVVPGNFENAARARADRGPVGIGAASRDSLHFESETIADRIAQSFLHLDHHRFFRIGAVGILRGNLHAVEDAEVVELPLGFCDIAFAQRAPGLDFHLAPDNSRSGELIAGQQYLGNLDLPSFGHVVDQADLSRSAAGKNILVECRLGKPLVVVQGQNIVAIARHSGFRIGLALG